MFAWMKRPPTVAMVDRGRVFCPVRHEDRDVDGCLSCPHLATMTEDSRGKVTEIACRVPSTGWAPNRRAGHLG